MTPRQPLTSLWRFTGHRRTAILLGSLLAVIAVTGVLVTGPLSSAAADPAKAADPAGVDQAKAADAFGVVSSEPDAEGLITRLRPFMSRITTGDPVRVALHFDQKLDQGAGPIAMGSEVGNTMLDRAATAGSLEVAVRIDDGPWKVLRPEAGENPAQWTMLYANPSFLLDLDEDAVRLLDMNGREELRLPWAWERPFAPGKLQIAIRGKLRVAESPKKPGDRTPVEQRPQRDIGFQSKPAEIEVVKATDQFKTLPDLEAAAIKALTEKVDGNGENLKVGGLDQLSIADGQGNRVIRIRANPPPPAAPALGQPIFLPAGGGMGYWRYEMTVAPTGEVKSFARQMAGFCVAKGTMIDTPEGLRPVEEIRAGQMVWSYDDEQQARVEGMVQGVMSSLAAETLQIPAGPRVTAPHPIWAAGKWRPAAALRQDDQLLTSDLERRAAGHIERITGLIEVFDLSVAGPHCFFADGVLVHNKSIAWTPEHFVPWYALWRRIPVDGK